MHVFSRRQQLSSFKLVNASGILLAKAHALILLALESLTDDDLADSF